MQWKQHRHHCCRHLQGFERELLPHRFQWSSLPAYTWQPFTWRIWGFPPDYVIEAVTPLVNRLSALAPGSPFWIEIHEENKALRELVERRLGFHYVMTKIMASSDIKGLYVRPQVVELPKLKACEIPSFVRLVPDFLSSKELEASLLELREYASRRKVPWYSTIPSTTNGTLGQHSVFARGYCRNDPTFHRQADRYVRALGRPHILSFIDAPCRNTTVARYFGIFHGRKASIRIPGPERTAPCPFHAASCAAGELSRHAT